MWCHDQKRWVPDFSTNYPKGASSHKHFLTASKAWNHATNLKNQGIEFVVVRNEHAKYKKANGKRRRLSTVWVSEDYYK